MRLKRQKAPKGVKLTGKKKWLDCECGESELVDEMTVKVTCGRCLMKQSAKLAPVDKQTKKG